MVKLKKDCNLVIGEKMAVVQKYLQTEPATRDDDNLLIYRIWEKETRNIYTRDQMLAMIREGKLSNTRSIVRARAKLQEVFVSLRGEKYTKRKRRADAVSEEMLADKE